MVFSNLDVVAEQRRPVARLLLLSIVMRRCARGGGQVALKKVEARNFDSVADQVVMNECLFGLTYAVNTAHGLRLQDWIDKWFTNENMRRRKKSQAAIKMYVSWVRV